MLQQFKASNSKIFSHEKKDTFACLKRKLCNVMNKFQETYDFKKCS